MEVRFKFDFLQWREGQVVQMTAAHAKQLLSFGIVEEVLP
jgi:hypothetical protein